MSKVKNNNYNPSEVERKWPRKRLTSSRMLTVSRSRGASLRGKQEYNPSLIEQKWQAVWEREKIYSPNLDTTKKPFYNLMMFPYPSAEGMHVGNMYAFTGADVYGRFKRMQGFSVFEPIGLDGFGIHSENYAIKVGNHPAQQAKISEKNFYKQLHAIGNAFDWERTVETYKPNYYKWTQWLFIQLFKAGLAYRKKAPVNFCPSCKTVLADEQILEGKCERCETEVVKKDLEQWFFKITKYADRLLANIPKLDWSEKVKIAQRQWIGRSEGTLIRFKIKDLRFENEEIEVFTTRADTLCGAAFLVLSPEHPFSLARGRLARLEETVKEYVKKAKKKTEQDRVAEGKEKTGVSTGLYAINPLNQEKIPVWIADYALMEYGTGALFGDAHDERDVIFAKKYGIPLKPTLKTGDPDKDKKIKNLEECFTGYGILVDSGEFSGLPSKEAIVKITSWLEKNGVGRKETTYHLRDWLISRQRYWGPPIPMIYCEKCDWQPVLEKDLPVELPFIKDYKPLGIHSASSGQAVKAPLASHPEFYKTKCPNCGREAKRETDVSDTFLDSAWYFLRYLATEFDNLPFPSQKFLEYKENSANQSVRKSDVFDNQNLRSTESSEVSQIDKRLRWLPVSMYIGGAEHSVLHLLYSRFITMVLKDLGFIDFEEPFTKFRAHGLLVKDGAKMSKSKGNVVIPDEYIKKFGADTLRTYLMFMGPFSQGGDFRDTGIEGMHRFLRRVFRLASENPKSNPSASLRARIKNSKLSKEGSQIMNKTIKKVTEDIEKLNYNTAIAALMEYYNFLAKQKVVLKEELGVLVRLIAPFMPHMAEEIWEKLGQNFSVHKEEWPKSSQRALIPHETIIVAQVNGNKRDILKVTMRASKEQKIIEQLARESDKIKKYLDGKQIKKIIYVEGKVINFVV